MFDNKEWNAPTAEYRRQDVDSDLTCRAPSRWLRFRIIPLGHVRQQHFSWPIPNERPFVFARNRRASVVVMDLVHTASDVYSRRMRRRRLSPARHKQNTTAHTERCRIVSYWVIRQTQAAHSTVSARESTARSYTIQNAEASIEDRRMPTGQVIFDVHSGKLNRFVRAQRYG